MRVCVFCSSSDRLSVEYRSLAEETGAALAASGHQLVYGGGSIGLMGIVARAVHQGGGRVVGVIPRALRDYGLAYEDADELVVTATLRERKAAMEERADAFLALPGGIGTLEEVLEIVTLKQLLYHSKAVVLLNACGYFDDLLAQLERSIAEGFARPEMRGLYHVSPTVSAALAYLAAYVPGPAADKWLRDLAPQVTEAMEGP